MKDPHGGGGDFLIGQAQIDPLWQINLLINQVY